MLGETICHTVMPASMSTMKPKNAAVTGVQAIQSIFMTTLLDPAQGEALGHMVADKPDDQGARHDGQDAGRGQQAPVEP